MANVRSRNWSLNNEFEDDDDDDDPLLADNTTAGNTDLRSRTVGRVVLAEEETHRLVECLTDLTDLLIQSCDTTYLEGQLRQTQRSTSFLSRIWSRVRTPFWHTVRRFTGGLGIAATIMLQLVCLVMLSLVDCLPQTKEDKARALHAGSIGMMVLQTINLIVVILVSVQLFRQIHTHRVSRVLLLQSFVATILLFAGIYTATYRLNRNSWKFVTHTNGDSPVQIVTVDYIEFLFFSVSTATLCGAADSVPNEWYTSLFASVQMLLSFVYFTSVLGPSVSESDINQTTLANKLHALRTRLRHQRESLSRE